MFTTTKGVSYNLYTSLITAVHKATKLWDNYWMCISLLAKCKYDVNSYASTHHKQGLSLYVTFSHRVKMKRSAISACLRYAFHLSSVL